VGLVSVATLAKDRLDFGLFCHELESAIRFWRDEVQLPGPEVLRVSKVQEQHRFDAGGSVIKVNHLVDPIPDGAHGGYRELLLAREGMSEARSLTAPGGSRVRLVPLGSEGVMQAAVRVRARHVEHHRRFYRDALGLIELAGQPGTFSAGETLLFLEPGAQRDADGALAGPGWRYLTLQVTQVDEAHRHAVAHGAREAMPPTTLGRTARISMILDPDGNWIELSQRASLVGHLRRE
jgi:catechol 2,3-dioxygenase-like lactoylglutathione lyase family enzyme